MNAQTTPPQGGGRPDSALLPLTPLALENAELLFRLEAQDFGTKTELAQALGRDLPNLNKTLKRLQAEDLVAGEQLTDLTAAGANAVRVLRQLQGGESAGPMPEGYAAIPLRQIFPDELNPRKHFDEAALGELASSIARDGLLENLVVRRDPKGMDVLSADEAGREVRLPAYRVVAGERRWRALNLLVEGGELEFDAPIPCRVVELDDAGHRRVALVENLQRRDLRPIDEAQALRELMDVTGAGTAEVAAEIGFTQRFVQQRLQLLELPEAQREQLQERRMSIEEARRWLANRPAKIELTPRQELIFAEFLHKARHAPRKGLAGSVTEVSYKADSDGDLKVLIKHNLVSFNREDWQDRRAYLSRSWGAGDLLGELWPKLEDPAGGELLTELRRAAAREQNVEAAESGGKYLTSWLNGPFELSPEAARKLEADKAAKAKEKEKAKAAKEKREQTLKAYRDLDAELRNAFAGQPLDGRLDQLLKAAGVKLPLELKNGRVVDAAGAAAFDVNWRFAERGEAVNLLLATIVNAACGYGVAGGKGDGE